MIAGILRLARRLDEKLKSAAGKPYHAILGAGLVIEIIRRGRELAEMMKTPHERATIAGMVLAILFGLMLLVNQLAELSHHFDGRRPAAKPEH